MTIKDTAAANGLSNVELDSYLIADAEKILTPALAIYPEVVDWNIARTIERLGNDPNRWRPHVKTAKLAYVMRRFVGQGVKNFKCSTSLELLTLCEAGATDVLVAYPLVGAGARRVRDVADSFPAARVSALVESREQVEAWAGSRVGLFIDVNPGMDRTGIGQGRTDEIIRLARAVAASGQEFRGLHYYDGHLAKYEMAERERIAHLGYDRLLEIVEAVGRAGLRVGEVITAGTPAFPCSASYSRFGGAKFIHRASPGTVVYCDCTSLAQLPPEFGYRPAAIVISTVVSRPAPGRVTCDAGHKTVSADAGVPTCRALGRPGLSPSRPSEEHLPIDVSQGYDLPAIGDMLYLVPMHVCPTVNNFDHALIVSGGRVTAVERVTARGREIPLLV
jgi:D-serine deaminase-like pyridoxal phosphate-dependent protein